ncbi:7199_t:CDS:2, partial [Acaulospora colombiana]
MNHNAADQDSSGSHRSSHFIAREGYPPQWDDYTAQAYDVVLKTRKIDPNTDAIYYHFLLKLVLIPGDDWSEKFENFMRSLGLSAGDEENGWMFLRRDIAFGDRELLESDRSSVNITTEFESGRNALNLSLPMTPTESSIRNRAPRKNANGDNRVPTESNCRSASVKNLNNERQPLKDNNSIFFGFKSPEHTLETPIFNFASSLKTVRTEAGTSKGPDNEPDGFENLHISSFKRSNEGIIFKETGKKGQELDAHDSVASDNDGNFYFDQSVRSNLSEDKLFEKVVRPQETGNRQPVNFVNNKLSEKNTVNTYIPIKLEENTKHLDITSRTVRQSEMINENITIIKTSDEIKDHQELEKRKEHQTGKISGINPSREMSNLKGCIGSPREPVTPLITKDDVESVSTSSSKNVSQSKLQIASLDSMHLEKSDTPESISEMILDSQMFEEMHGHSIVTAPESTSPNELRVSRDLEESTKITIDSDSDVMEKDESVDEEGIVKIHEYDDNDKTAWSQDHQDMMESLESMLQNLTLTCEYDKYYDKLISNSQKQSVFDATTEEELLSCAFNKWRDRYNNYVCLGEMAEDDYNSKLMSAAFLHWKMVTRRKKAMLKAAEDVFMNRYMLRCFIQKFMQKQKQKELLEKVFWGKEANKISK